jgi:hypothetical protein
MSVGGIVSISLQATIHFLIEGWWNIHIGSSVFMGIRKLHF